MDFTKVTVKCNSLFHINHQCFKVVLDGVFHECMMVRGGWEEGGKGWQKGQEHNMADWAGGRREGKEWVMPSLLPNFSVIYLIYIIQSGLKRISGNTYFNESN